MEYLIHRDYNTYGIDLSSLSEKFMFRKKLSTRFLRGDLLYLGEHFPDRQFDTIIFSSVLHEVYSYNDFDMQKVIETLQQAVNLLSEQGRIIIRDGINHPDDSQQRIIEFINDEDIEVFYRYCKYFKGRAIPFKQLNNKKILLSINNAMEFLYTYTWGHESFYREVQEQYGILNAHEYQNLLKSFGLTIIHESEYLQAGYIENLEPKINLYDEQGNTVDFPNSNMLLIAEK